MRRTTLIYFLSKFILFKILKAMRKIKVYYRLAIAFSIIIIVPSLIIGYVSYSKSSKEIDSNTLRFSYQYISNINSNTDERLRKYNALADMINNDRLIVSQLVKLAAGEQSKSIKGNICDYLYYISGNDVTVKNIELITETDEFTQISMSGESRGGKIDNLEAFRKSESYIRAMSESSNYLWCDTSKENAIIIGQGFNKSFLGGYVTLLKAVRLEPDGKPLGIIMINVSLSVFVDKYSVEEIINNGNLLLIGDSGIIASLNENTTAPYLDSETMSLAKSLNSGTVVKKVSGVECLLTFQKSEETGWYLLSIIPRDVMLSSILSIRKIIIVTVAICLLASFIIAYLVTLSINLPMKNLRNLMDKLDENRLDVHYQDTEKDDVGILGEHFNHMIDRINNLVKSVYKYDIIKKSEEIKRKQAELDALQMQINPHFLYNTLDIIRWQAIADELGDGKFSRMIADFSALLRLSTMKCGNMVRLTEELEHIKAYIKVVSLSYDKCYDLKFDIESDEICNTLLPKLSLQPIVENSVTHGFKNIEHERSILIRSWKSDEGVCVEISDNGNGIEEDKLRMLKEGLKNPEQAKGGLGLKNVNERLKLAFGEDYGININSIKGRGTSVRIKLPDE